MSLDSHNVQEIFVHKNQIEDGPLLSPPTADLREVSSQSKNRHRRRQLCSTGPWGWSLAVSPVVSFLYATHGFPHAITG